jgi:hypothetical protein
MFRPRGLGEVARRYNQAAGLYPEALNHLG